MLYSKISFLIILLNVFKQKDYSRIKILVGWIFMSYQPL